ncbi:MAG TPA: TIGR02757 family protein [Armatimonadota bacterium]|jgi:uncharacterized protein (TIGR02757 family)
MGFGLSGATGAESARARQAPPDAARALEAAYGAARWAAWAEADPLGLVRLYDDPRDQEIAGFIAAGLAYGRVASILASVSSILSLMPQGPRAFLETFRADRDAAVFERCIHRFHTAESVVAMLETLRIALERHSSLEAMFLSGHSPGAPDIGPALCNFVDGLRSITVEAYGPDWANGLYGWRHALASPADGSACKRLNLFLRWMVRTGPPDLGAWRGIHPRRLVIPVDVHVARIARRLGLTARASPDWRMAMEITAALRSIDPEDPIRFDFVISHIGMEGEAWT